MHHSEHDTDRAVTDNTSATVSRPAPPFPPTTPERRPSYFEHFSRGKDLTVAFRGGSTATVSTPPFWNRRAAALGAALSFAFMLPYNRSLGLVLRAGRAGRAARNELGKGTVGMPEDGRSSHLVVVGSSAGVVQALSEMVSTLPGQTPRARTGRSSRCELSSGKARRGACSKQGAVPERARGSGAECSDGFRRVSWTAAKRTRSGAVA